jgi:hypothetical protein
MINIPFNRCVIVTTLNFGQIIERLEGAIYDPHFSSSIATDRAINSQSYLGKIQGFNFLATKLLGFKYFHLPTFLSPTIEGKIDSLHHGYEISLRLKLQNITFALLLTCLGGLFTTISAILDNLLTGSKNYQYLTTVETIAVVYILILVYFYFAARRETKFFKTLFIKGFTAANHTTVDGHGASWSEDFQFQEIGNCAIQRLATAEPATGWLKQNLPSFPSPDRADRDRQQMKTRLQIPESRDLLKQNLPSFPKLDRDSRDSLM